MNNNKIYPWYFNIGAVIVYFTLFFLPCLLGIFYSFTDWNSFDPSVHFVGLENFKTIFMDDKVYLFYIGNTIKFTIITTILKTVIGFTCALLFTKGVKAANLHRMIMFSPQVLSYLIVGLVFRSMLHPTNGFVNNFLNAIGLGVLAQDWLGSVKWAFPTVMLVDTWKGAGYIMVVFIAGLQAISSDYYEASEIDGATFWQKTIHITIPLLMPAISTVTVLNITYGLRVFDIIYVLTNGGPGYATGVINTQVFKEFSEGRYAVGTAMSTILFIIVALISYFIIKAFNRKEVDY